MLYPINSYENRNSVAFQKQIRRVAVAGPEKIATINFRVLGKINNLKSIYLEMINRVRDNNVLAAKMIQGINNIRIEDSIITVFGENNESVKLSMIDTGVAKLFRIKFFEDKELKNIITLDNYKVVERVNKSEIIYSKESSINMEALVETIENLYESLDEPFLELKRYMRTNDFTQSVVSKAKSIKFKQTQEPKEIVPGVTVNMLPASRAANQEEKPLFSYAALIGKTAPEKKSLEKAKENKNVEKSFDKPKRKLRSSKVSGVPVEKTEKLAPKRTGRVRKATVVPTVETQVRGVTRKTRKMIDNSHAGQLPVALSERINQIEDLYQEINNIWGEFKHSKLGRVKRAFNIRTRRKHGFDFEEPNGDRISLIRLAKKDFKDSNLLKITFNASNSSQEVFAVIDNAKNIVGNLSGKNHQFYTKLRYQTQSELDAFMEQTNFQAILDKIFNRLTVLKNSLVKKEWKKPVKPDYQVNESVLQELNTLWKQLKLIEESGKANNLPKREFSILKTQRGFGGFDFVDNDSSILFDKVTNRYGTQFRIVIKENGSIKESYLITEDGKFVKNAKNGLIPRVGNMVFVKAEDFSGETIDRIMAHLETLEKWVTRYAKETKQKINGTPLPKISTKTVFQPEGMNYREVKTVMNRAVRDLENALDDIKKNFGVVNKFNQTVDKVRKDFENFLLRFNQNK